MITTCKNCGHQLEGRYCCNCSQESDTRRLTLFTIWDDIRTSLLGYNGKAAYTTRQLMTRPGHAIREYVEGRRISHLKPTAYVILLAGIYGVLSHYFHLHVIDQNPAGDSLFDKLGFEESNDWIIRHYAWIALFSVPLFALGSFLSFRKDGYNLAEHLVINSFLTGQRFLFLIALFPLQYAFDNSPHLPTVRWGGVFLQFILMAWGYLQLFNRSTRTRVFCLLLVTWMIFLVCVIIISLVLSVGIEWVVQ